MVPLDGEVKLRDGSSSPAHNEMHLGVALAQGDVDFLQQSTEQFLSVTVLGGGAFPYPHQVAAEATEGVSLPLGGGGTATSQTQGNRFTQLQRQQRRDDIFPVR